MYGKCGNLEKTEEIFSRVPRLVLLHPLFLFPHLIIIRNIVSYNTMIGILGHHTLFSKAIQLFWELKYLCNEFFI
jgi:pentatricopeptide repeat protein